MARERTSYIFETPHAIDVLEGQSKSLRCSLPTPVQAAMASLTGPEIMRATGMSRATQRRAQPIQAQAALAPSSWRASLVPISASHSASIEMGSGETWRWATVWRRGDADLTHEEPLCLMHLAPAHTPRTGTWLVSVPAALTWRAKADHTLLHGTSAGHAARRREPPRIRRIRRTHDHALYPHTSQDFTMCWL